VQAALRAGDLGRWRLPTGWRQRWRVVQAAGWWGGV